MSSSFIVNPATAYGILSPYTSQEYKGMIITAANSGVGRALFCISRRRGFEAI